MDKAFTAELCDEHETAQVVAGQFINYGVTFITAADVVDGGLLRPCH